MIKKESEEEILRKWREEGRKRENVKERTITRKRKRERERERTRKCE